MKFLVLDAGGGVGLDIAYRAKIAGHEVKLYLKPGKHPNTGRGLVDRVEDWRKWMRWADLIFMTDNAYYHDDLRKYFDEGYPIFGCSPRASDIELKRGIGQELLDQCGIPVPPYMVFDDYEKAEKYVLECNTRFVSKPMGDADKALSYVSKSPADMIYMLRRWKKSGKLKGEFMLQDFIGGIEFGVTGWFGPGGFSKNIAENFEHKKLMNDDKGVNTGEMGTAVRYVKESKLAEKVLFPCAPALAALRYIGAIDVNCIIDKKGNVWPLEFTARPGWPIFYILSALHKGDPIQWMVDCLHGVDSLEVDSRHAVGVVLTIPDFPYSHLTGKEVDGVPIYGINQGNIDKIRIGEVRAGIAPCMVDGKVKEQEIFVSSGDYLACVVGKGSTLHRARKDAYATVDELEIPNSLGYRTDIGKKMETWIPELQALGYATDWEYGDE